MPGFGSPYMYRALDISPLTEVTRLITIPMLDFGRLHSSRIESEGT